MTIPVQIQFVSEEAKNLYNGKLEYATDGSSGFDLRACEFDFVKRNGTNFYGYWCDNPHGQWGYIGEDTDNGFLIAKGGSILVKTGIKVKLPIPHIVKYDDCDNLPHIKKFQNLELAESFIKENGGWINPHRPEPSGQYEIQVRSRSGLALKHGITVLNSPGTIDSDYNKEIGVILYNAGHEPFEIEKGMRIAQAVICPVIRGNFEYVDDIEDGGRGGYGSTGIK
jgi:dUTPase